jgi:hypothetical protein
VHGYLTESPTFEFMFLFHLNLTIDNRDKIVLSNRMKPPGGAPEDNSILQRLRADCRIHGSMRYLGFICH